MTICISAIADTHEAVVSCVDTRVSTNVTSFDPVVGRKICGMRGWTILSSGMTCYAESLVDTFEGLLGKAEDNDPPTIKGLLEKAQLEELQKYNAAKYLAPYGIDMPTFLKSRGATGFSDERWNELSRSILDYSDTYDVELLVTGWGGTQEKFSGSGAQAGACIFHVSREGISPHSDDGFYVCGSGGPAAHSILSYFNHEPHDTLARAIHNVAAAKFMSERTEKVGPNTVMRVTTRLGAGDWRGYFIQPDEIDEIRRLWDESGAPRMSDKAEDAIVSIVAKHQKSQTVSWGHMDRTLDKLSGTEPTPPSTSETSKPEQ